MTKYFLFETSEGIFDSRNMKIFIEKIHRPVMPEITPQYLNIGEKAGAYLLGKRLESIYLQVDIHFLNSANEIELRKDLRELARVLYRDEGKGKLFFSDELGVFYNVQMVGNTNFNYRASMGVGSLEFLAADPFAYSKNEKKLTIRGSRTIANEGTAPTFPIFKITPNKGIVDINIKNESTGKHLLLTGAFEAGRTIVINHIENRIFEEGTGKNRIKDLELSSEFFELKRGENIISISADFPDQMSEEIIFRERFL